MNATVAYTIVGLVVTLPGLITVVLLGIRARDARRDAARNPQFGPVNRWGRLDRKPIPEHLDDHYAEDTAQWREIERQFSPAEPTDDAALRSDVAHVAAIVQFTEAQQGRINELIRDADRKQIWGRIR
jgi:hypothetical protein